jgi:hypothetical protein
MGLLLPVEGGLEALCDQALSNAMHGIDTDGEALSDLLIRPGRPICVGFQQDMRLADLVGGSFAFPG